MPFLFLCNTCARAELRQQERARKLCSATLIDWFYNRTTIISWVRRDKVWSTGFNVKMVLLSRATGSVSSGNLSAFDVISSKARETTY